ncbi:hypothetical protein [Demequina globuliformis]|uniref:hypothetical protein n=1 Tax=Demequina globuliformis TaxID=676202 RepID=UPI000782AF41|nr:hypothetical protein [Demequina globuliformis]
MPVALSVESNAVVLRASLGAALIATIAASALWFGRTDASFPSRYQAVESEETSDILAAAVESGPQLYEAYSLSQAVGETAPGAVMVFPDGGTFQRTWTGMRLAGYGKAERVTAVDTPALELWGRLAFTGDEETYSVPGQWDIILDAAGSHSVLVHLAPTTLTDPELVVEARLIDLGIDEGSE